MEIKAPVSRTCRASRRREAGVEGVGRRALRWRRVIFAFERSEAVCGLLGGREESWERIWERSFSDDMVDVVVAVWRGGMGESRRLMDISAVSGGTEVDFGGRSRWMEGGAVESEVFGASSSPVLAKLRLADFAQSGEIETRPNHGQRHRSFICAPHKSLWLEKQNSISTFYPSYLWHTVSYV